MRGRIVEGYRSGLIGEIARLHAEYYSDFADFPPSFEALVAREMANFVDRLDHPQSQTWFVEADGRVAGGISLDGEDLGVSVAHLRWFILSSELKGCGVGRKLIERAIQFAGLCRKNEIVLWTFAGLDAARHLYESSGFVLIEEKLGAQWGREVLEQKFVLQISR